MYSCLIIEDDSSIRNLINSVLKDQYKVYMASSGQIGIAEFARKNPDFLILDLGLPDIDGLEVLQTIRSWSDKPVIVVSARSEDKDKVGALDNGADDYLLKPFSIDELQARIRVVIRRLAKSEKLDEAIFKNGELKINYLSNQVFMNDQEIHLTPSEYRILVLMSKNIGKVLTHKILLDELWHSNTNEYDLATLRVFMVGLRKKIEKDPSQPKYIITHLGTGYRLAYVD